MTDIAWIGIEEAAKGARGWGFDAGGTPCTEVHGDDAAAIRAKTPDTPALVVSDRAAPPARAVPAQVLPDTGALSPLTQAAPPGLLPATACLRLAGVLATRPQWDGVCLLPGTDVTHWVHVSAGEVVSFASFLTPRLAQLLGADAASPSTVALGDTMTRPERLAAHLAQADLSNDTEAALGHLIGAEIAAARPYWLGQPIVQIGGGALAAGYATALAEQGAPLECLTDCAAAQAGLVALHGR